MHCVDIHGGRLPERDLHRRPKHVLGVAGTAVRWQHDVPVGPGPRRVEEGMQVLWRRALAAVLSLTAAGGGLVTAASPTVTTGSFSFVGESGDYISQGEAYSYSTSDGDSIYLGSGPIGPTGTSVVITV